MRGGGKRAFFRLPFAAAALLCLLVKTPAAFADSVSQTASDGFGRMLFTLDPPDKPIAAVKDGVLTIGFGRKIALDPQQTAHGLEAYISSARSDADGMTFRFALVQNVRLHASYSANRYALDLVPNSFNGTPPDLPPPPPPQPKSVDISKLEPLAVRAGAYASFTRLVFDWHKTVPYTVFRGTGRITIRFEAEARPDFHALERIAPPWLKQAGWRIENRGTVIDFNTEAESGYRDFRDGTHVVVDVLAPETDAAAYNPPGGGKTNAPVMPAKKGARNDPQLSAAQAEAVAATAEKLNAKTDETAQPDANPNTQRDAAKSQDTALPPSTSAAANADAQRTREGASLSFSDVSGAAVFIRGMTAWIVLDGAPAIDPAHLKTALGDFPASVDAASGDGVSVLRIGLRTPERIAARSVGSTLHVVLSPHTGTEAAGIDFVREDGEDGRTALVTLLPGGHRTVRIPDPAVGDALIVVPGAAGRAIPGERRYLEFVALPSAAGLVLTPLADDLDVSVHDGRVAVTRPGGLTLTPPQMPPVDSPAALARNGDGPSFIDFSIWKNPVKGSFLEQQRILRGNIARLGADNANPARLSLARFYIANEFDAEALGEIDLIEASDPSLRDDPQLRTIRAAADVMMGRYKDAHDALAGGGFDNDRHAALWRGLSEAALENWDAAREALLTAMPAIGRYPFAWQARARIALARASVRTGALESADAALGHLPRVLPRSLFLDSELARAELYAAEGRYRDAHVLFAAVEKGTDDRAAAEAIYEDAVAGLSAGAIGAAAAAARLETLRYRWRGDGLEMKTLRKLGALYFAQKRWREGLETLRIATGNFLNDDQARTAQDDMRNAFSALFLKGKADAMPPVEALALFYDFIDLTPIGADGDEMIRRMADRLVAVDLLGPAAGLLKYQVEKRLDGVARAQVATRLAMIELLDHNAKDALAALRTTRIAGLPDDIGHARLLLEARALAALKQWDEAIDLTAVDDAPDTRRLRADIYWESGNWAMAAEKAEALLDGRWNEPRPLSADERHDAMRAAIAYSLADDESGLERLRDRFAAKMQGSPDASAFAVVTERIDMQGVAFRDVAGKIASLDTLESFMKDFKKRYDRVAAAN